MSPTALLRPRRALAASFALASMLAAPAAFAAADPTYVALRAARPDGRSLATANLTLERDAYRFTFEQGALHFLSPVEGRTVGAVFVGKGRYQLTPATEGERRHLALLAGEPALQTWSDTFERALLLFADDTFEALSAAHAVNAGTPDGNARAAFDAAFAWQRDLDRFATNFHRRILLDLLNAPESRSGVFLAVVDGSRLSPALAAVDPRGAEAIGLADGLGGEDVALFSAATERKGFWYLSHRKSELERRQVTPHQPVADARHYRIDTRVLNNTEIDAETAITFEATSAGLRVLPLHLMRKLRISDVQWTPGDGATGAAWQPAAWIQEHPNEDSDPAVVLPQPLAQGAVATVRVRYAGKEVLFDIGDRNYVVASRTDWYPNLATFEDLATFDLTFHLPAKSDIVATGEPVATKEDKSGVLSSWRSTSPLRVAGFNYGRFKKKERKETESGRQLEVFYASGTPGYLRELQAELDDSGVGGEQGALPEGFDDPLQYSGGASVAPNVSNLNTGTMAESMLDDATNATRVFRTYFGDVGYKRLAISQQAEWYYGQSWPTLVFLPYWSFLHGGLRQQLGLQGVRAADVEGLTFHEIAHQWWGHEVGWAGYRDQWLSEGFAQFSALLALQFTRGWKDVDRFLELERKDLFEWLPGGGNANDSGPITLGQRLENHRTRGVYQRVVYGKGMYVLHMLRQLMRDSRQANPDANFMAAMSDFVKTYSGKNPSTDDFQHVLEKHMTPYMNATGDGKLDWFFAQWVHGTEVPKLASDLKIAKDGDGYRITGSISQSEVSSQFRTMVPLYVEIETKKGPATAQVSAVPIIGTMTRQLDIQVTLPGAPKRAFLNAHYDVLTRP